MERTEEGNTPLHDAAMNGTSENIQALLKAGAEVMERTEEGNTPLHSAVLQGSCGPGVIQDLLTAGANVNAKNNEGETPWYLAQKNDEVIGTKGYWALDEARFK